MKAIPILTAAALASLALAACDKPGTKTGAAGGADSTTTTTTTIVATPPTNPAQTADSTTPNTPAATASSATPPSTMPSATSSTAMPSSTMADASSNVVNDTMLTGKVKSAITADNAMKDSDISVKSENGIVTLSGNVKSPEQVTLAAALAQRQEGVSRVENQVAVQ